MSIDEVAASVIEVFEAPAAAPSRGLYLVDEAGDTLTLVAQRGMPPAAVEQFARFPVGADLPGSIAVRERRTVISKTQANAISEFASLRDVPRSTSGFAAIPLLGDGSCVGVLSPSGSTVSSITMTWTSSKPLPRRWPKRSFGSGCSNANVAVLYTEGITDLPPPHGITPEEFAAVIHRNRHGDVDRIANAIHHSLLGRVPDRRTRDDAAVLIMAIDRPA